MSDAKQSGYNAIYAGLCKRLQTLAFDEAAMRLGMALAPGGGALCPFLGRAYVIDGGGVRPQDGGDAPVNVRSVLAYYALSGGGGEPEYVYAVLSAKSEGLHAAGPAGDLDWMVRPLRELADADFEAFCAGLARAGAGYGGQKGGGHLWHLRVLPKIPARVGYEAADEEFGSRLYIHYDTGAGRFLSFEQLAFMNGCVVDGICRAAAGRGQLKG